MITVFPLGFFFGGWSVGVGEWAGGLPPQQTGRGNTGLHILFSKTLYKIHSLKICKYISWSLVKLQFLLYNYQVFLCLTQSIQPQSWGRQLAWQLSQRLMAERVVELFSTGRAKCGRKTKASTIYNLFQIHLQLMVTCKPPFLNRS